MISVLCVECCGKPRCCRCCRGSVGPWLLAVHPFRFTRGNIAAESLPMPLMPLRYSKKEGTPSSAAVNSVTLTFGFSHVLTPGCFRVVILFSMPVRVCMYVCMTRLLVSCAAAAAFTLAARAGSGRRRRRTPRPWGGRARRLFRVGPLPEVQTPRARRFRVRLAAG